MAPLNPCDFCSLRSKYELPPVIIRANEAFDELTHQIAERVSPKSLLVVPNAAINP